MIRYDVLGPGDARALESFLVRYREGSMFLRANIRLGGMIDQGKTYQATYVAARSGGVILGVAAVAWNGKLILQAPEETAEVAIAAAGAAPREVNGIIGPWQQVLEARRALGMQDRRAALDSRDGLFALELADLKVPAPLVRGEVAFRPAVGADGDLLVPWRRAYHVELLGGKPGKELDATARTEFEEALAARRIYVLTRDGAPVATTAFNAHLPDMVQVGGVYTPPHERGRGYARCAVAGSLLEARTGGAQQAILFTGDSNVAATRAYLNLGFRRIGDYGLVLF